MSTKKHVLIPCYKNELLLESKKSLKKGNFATFASILKEINRLGGMEITADYSSDLYFSSVMEFDNFLDKPLKEIIALPDNSIEKEFLNKELGIYLFPYEELEFYAKNIVDDYNMLMKENNASDELKESYEIADHFLSNSCPTCIYWLYTNNAQIDVPTVKDALSAFSGNRDLGTLESVNYNADVGILYEYIPEVIDEHRAKIEEYEDDLDDEEVYYSYISALNESDLNKAVDELLKDVGEEREKALEKIGVEEEDIEKTSEMVEDLSKLSPNLKKELDKQLKEKITEEDIDKMLENFDKFLKVSASARTYASYSTFVKYRNRSLKAITADSSDTVIVDKVEQLMNSISKGVNKMKDSKELLSLLKKLKDKKFFKFIDYLDKKIK